MRVRMQKMYLLEMELQYQAEVKEMPSDKEEEDLPF
jgi:hypothetical protein